jgi:hypothetical protein
MIPKTIGLHVAKVANSLDKRQGIAVAMGFIVGCVIWLLSWLLDLPKFSISAVRDSVTGIDFTGEWVRNNVASTLIGVSSTFAIILAYLQITGQHFDQFRARYTLRRHIIICGMSSRGQVLARDLVNQGFDVVIVDLDPPASKAQKQRQAGVCVVFGDATNPDVLFGAGIVRATRVICLTASDDTNCAIAEACRHLLAEEKHAFSGELSVHCHIQDMHLRSQLSRLPLFVLGLNDQAKQYSARFRLFCIEACAATELITQFPPERYLPRQRHRHNVHIVILGVSGVADALLMQIAQIAHYWRPESEFKLPMTGVRVTQVGEGAAARWQQLVGRTPALQDLVSMQIVDFPLEDVEALKQLDNVFVTLPPTQVFVTLPNAMETLSQSLFLLDRYDSSFPKQHEGSVVAVFPPQLNPIDVDRWKCDDRLQWYGLYDACSADVVVGEAQDVLAKRIHEDYFNTYVANKNYQEPALDDGTAKHPWDHLNEWYRDSNRFVVAHMDVKLRTSGLVKADKANASNPVTAFPAVDIEELSEMEHRRWLAFHRMGGWQYAKDPKVSARLHPSIRPYFDLDDDEKKKDRDNVTGVFSNLAMVGQVVVPFSSDKCGTVLVTEGRTQ